MSEGARLDVSPRESAVLAAVERRLSNVEIASELYISVRTVESHIAALRRKLGAESRAQLVEAAHRRRRAVIVPHNSFVGRAAEVAALRALLEAHRFVTVVGAGGCGKTRLALEVAARDERVPVIVDLERSTDTVGAIAAELGLVVDSPNALLPAVSVALESQPTLLMLDNADPVAASVPGLVDRLLATSTGLTVLVTTRTLLGGSDEVAFELEPLEISMDGACRLFYDRAAVAAPARPLTPADEPTVASIARRLDGLPLVIEIAAARLRQLSLAELAARLDEGFGWLDRAGAAGRHRTLEAAFDWTWDQLGRDERDALSRLAALPGPFALDLAATVTDIGAVLGLADRSLVSHARGSDRYRLLGTMRQCVLGRTGHRVLHESRAAHAEWVLAAVEPLALRARTDDSPTANRAAAELYADAAAAVEFALETEQQQVALRIARSVAVLLEQYGLRAEGRDAVARAATSIPVCELATTDDLFLLGQALCYGDMSLASELAEVALERGKSLAALHLAATVDAYVDGTREHLDAAESLAEVAADHWALGSIRQHRGISFRGQPSPDPAAALAAFESALESYALAGDAMHVNNARYMMASTAAELGLTERAIGWALQCEDYARYTGNEHELAHAVLARITASGEFDELDGLIQTFRAVGDLRCLTRCAFLGGDLELALEIARRAGDTAGQARALEGRIHSLEADGRPVEAARAYGALEAIIGVDVAATRLAGLSFDAPAVLEGRATEIARTHDSATSSFS